MEGEDEPLPSNLLYRIDLRPAVPKKARPRDGHMGVSIVLFVHGFTQVSLRFRKLTTLHK